MKLVNSHVNLNLSLSLLNFDYPFFFSLGFKEDYMKNDDFQCFSASLNGDFIKNFIKNCFNLIFIFIILSMLNINIFNFH